MIPECAGKRVTPRERSLLENKRGSGCPASEPVVAARRDRRGDVAKPRSLKLARSAAPEDMDSVVRGPDDLQAERWLPRCYC